MKRTRYSKEFKIQVANESIETGNAAIDAAENVAAVKEALAAAKSAMDEIKTDAQLTAEEKEEEELCPFCHEKHEGFWGAFVRFFHKILNFFKLISTKKNCG